MFCVSLDDQEIQSEKKQPTQISYIKKITSIRCINMVVCPNNSSEK